MAKLAFFTFGILHEPKGHPKVQPFYDRIPGVHAAAEQSAGFVDRSRIVSPTKDTWGDRVPPRFFIQEKHARAPMTLSLWDDIESVFTFAYSGAHAEALSHRAEWFLPREWPTYVAWWVADDHQPDFHEALGRLEQLHDSGSRPDGFDFKNPFAADGNPLILDRSRLRHGA